MIVLSAIGLWLSLEPRPLAPSPDQWAAVRDRIRQDWRAGDGVRVHPFWLREAAGVLAELEPKPDRPGLPDFIDVSLPPDPIFVQRHERLWLVSALGRAADAPVPGGDAVLEVEEALAGDILLRRYRLGESPILADLLDQLEHARVDRRHGDQRRACRWDGKHHDCKGHPWENVGVRVAEVGGAPRRCLVLHPYPDNGTVSVTWSEVELGAQVLLRVGLTLESARNEKGSEATVVVALDGREVWRHVEPPNAWNWTTATIDTSDRAGERASLRVEVSARQEAFRDLCADAFVLSRGL